MKKLVFLLVSFFIKKKFQENETKNTERERDSWEQALYTEEKKDTG